MNHREALQAIIKICAESSQYSRRMQAIHNTAMIALGFTENQRQDRHNKTAIRSEQYQEEKIWAGEKQAKRNHIKQCEIDTGERYEKQTKMHVC